MGTYSLNNLNEDFSVDPVKIEDVYGRDYMEKKKYFKYLSEEMEFKYREEIKELLLDDMNLLEQTIKIMKKYMYISVPFKNTKKIADEFYSEMEYRRATNMYFDLNKYNEGDEYCIIKYSCSTPTYISFSREKYCEIIKNGIEVILNYLFEYFDCNYSYKFDYRIENVREEINNKKLNYKPDNHNSQSVKHIDQEDDILNYLRREDPDFIRYDETGDHINHTFDSLLARVEFGYEWRGADYNKRYK